MNKERIRKTNIKRGQRTQKMMSFRCDNETAELLKDYPNKGRLINQLIKEYLKKNGEE